MPDDQRPPDLRVAFRGEEYVFDLGLPDDEPTVEGGTETGRSLMLMALDFHPRGTHRLNGPKWAEQALIREFGHAVEILEKGPGADIESNLPPGAIP